MSAAQKQDAADALGAQRERDVVLDSGRVATQTTIGAPERGTPIEIDPSTFRRNLPADWQALVPAPSSPHVALSRAIGNAKKGIKDDGGHAWLWRRIGTDKSGLSQFALVAQSTNAEAKQWDGTQRVVVGVTRDGAQGLQVFLPAGFTPPKTMADELQRVNDRYLKERGRLTHTDVRAIVNEVVLKRLGGVRVGGTSCFVVASGPDVRLSELAPALKLAGVDVLQAELFASSSGARMAPAVRKGLLAEVADLHAEALELEAGVRKGHRVQDTTIFDRLDQANSVLAKAEAFRSIIELGADDVAAAVEKARGAIRGLLRAAVECGVVVDGAPCILPQSHGGDHRSAVTVDVLPF